MSTDDLNIQQRLESAMARSVAPEDLRPGDFIAVTHATHQFLTCSMLDRAEFGIVRPARVTFLATTERPIMRVVEVCLPFVLVRKPDGKHDTLDVRHYSLVRVADRFGKKLFKRLARDGGSASALC